MAGNRQTTWGRDNLVITRDYNFRFNVAEADCPRLLVKLAKTSTGQDVVRILQWWHGTAEETAAWKWIGMDYDTAQACSAYARNLLTYAKYEWTYGAHVENNATTVGWYVLAYTPTMDSSVTIQKHGIGDLYDVVVEAKMTCDDYKLAPDAVNVTGSRPLAGNLGSIEGWNDNPIPRGRYFTTAGADNIVLTTPPTWKREFKIAGIDLSTVVPTGKTLSGYTFQTWYKVKTTYDCQLKYTGMTRRACKNLFNSLNQMTGWWHAYHPSIWIFNSTDKTFEWQEQTAITKYQTMNDFKAAPMMDGDGRLWEAELTLTQWDETYTTNPNAAWTPTWPVEWTRIPALSNYLPSNNGGN